MRTTEFSSALAGHPFVRGMSEAHLGVLSELALPVHFEAGEYIFRRGYPANCLAFGRRGRRPNRLTAFPSTTTSSRVATYSAGADNRG